MQVLLRGYCATPPIFVTDLAFISYTVGVRATLNFGDFQVSLEHGWLWDTTTIKTHVPTCKESFADHILPLFDSVLTHWHWDSLLDFVQVWLKLWTQGFLSSELLWEPSLRTCIGQLGTLVCNYTVHFRLNIVHSWNRINSRNYFYSQHTCIKAQTLIRIMGKILYTRGKKFSVKINYK